MHALTDAEHAECEQHVREMVDGWKAGEGAETAVEMVAKINAYRATFASTYEKPIPPAWTLRAPGSAPRASGRPSRRRTVQRRGTTRTSSRGSPRSSDDPPEPDDLAASVEAAVARHRAAAAFSGMNAIGDFIDAELACLREAA
jgi:hypothetical protein